MPLSEEEYNEVLRTAARCLVNDNVGPFILNPYTIDRLNSRINSLVVAFDMCSLNDVEVESRKVIKEKENE